MLWVDEKGMNQFASDAPDAHNTNFDGRKEFLQESAPPMPLTVYQNRHG
jgi:hypothetical protein